MIFSSSQAVGKQRLAQGKYTSGQIDVSTWSAAIEAEYATWQEGHS